ncbi:MAG: beta-ketoacyl-ACP synthase II [Gammaproteobacteria bacterium]|nr:MAG: beta-ketoacyl-ACP synthase II [Gammaproteobacteria bacterium]
MSQRRVVVTGLGIVSPVGLTVPEAWDNIIAGTSGIRPITDFDVSEFPVRFGGTIEGFDVSAYISKRDARRMERFIHYGVAAGTQAIRDSGLEITEENAERIGASIGSGIGGLRGIEANYDAYLKGGPRKISPLFVPANIINMIAGNLSIGFGLKGPNIAMVTACTSGTHSIGEAARIIAYGDADVMLAGGAEMATTYTGLGGFAAARALSTRNDDPCTASRPWDRDRDGFVLGDGAGVMMLEEYKHATARGATIYAEVSGYGMSGDAYHMTQPSKNGEGAARCMRNAIRDAGLNPDQIDYINAHGTSTQAGDVAEVQAIKTALGDHARKVAVSSTKSMTGHLLGAAGGVEAIFSVLAIRDQVAPPTTNQVTADPDCDLDFVPNEARKMKINAAMSNSFGFGGTNGAIVFTKLD